MSEPTGPKDTLLVKVRRPRPSQLRNEINLDSTDEDRVPDQDHVDVPDDDVVIRETQLEHCEDDKHALSPHALAVLAKNHHFKPPEALDSNPISFKLLSRLDPQGDQTASPEFTPFRPHSEVPEPAAKNDVLPPTKLPKPTAVTNASLPIIEQAAKDYLERQSHWEASPPRSRKHIKQDGQRSKAVAKPVEVQREAEIVAQKTGDNEVSGNGMMEPRALNDGQSKANHAISPSTQPGSSNVDHVQPLQSAVKRGKKGRKAQLGQQRDGSPWPPRSLHDRRPHSNTKSLIMEQPILDVISQPIADRAAPINRHEHINQTPKGQVDSLVDKSNAALFNDDESINYTPKGQVEVPLSVSNAPSHHVHISSTPDELAVRPVAMRTSTPINHVEYASSIPREKQPDATHTAISINYDKHVNSGSIPKKVITSPVVMKHLPHNHDRLAHGTPMNEVTGADIMRLAPSDESESSADSRHLDGVLHEISCRGGPSRIGKPYKESRTAAAPHLPIPMQRLGNDIGFIEEFDRTLETFRIVVHADKVNAQRAHVLQMEGREKTILALQEVTTLQKETIETLKDADIVMLAKMKRQADTVKKLEKYVKGLENDQAKIKANVKTDHDKFEKVWREKLRDVENEKDKLERQMAITDEALGKSRESMRTFMVDCSHRLDLSETKNTALVEKLKTHKALLEVDKKKSADLEQQIMSSLQSIQQRLDNNSGVVLEKLSDIWTSVENTTANEKQEACLKECMEALKSLCATPFLTAKDTQKAEGMLRFVHESVDTRLEKLSRSLGEQDPSSENLRSYICDQLRNLRTEILKYDEVSTKCQRVCKTNDHLNEQLNAEKERHGKLDERVKSLLQIEADLKSRSYQLETKLNAMKNATCSPGSEPASLNREISTLRSQLTKTEDNLQVAVDKLKHFDELRQGEHAEAATWKKLAQDKEAKLAEVAKRLKKFKEEREDLVETRARIEKEWRQTVRQKEATWANDLHRVTREKDDKQEALQIANCELDAAREALQNAKQSLRSTESETKDLRKEKIHVEFKLQRAQQSLGETKASLSELADLREQLRHKDDAFQTRDEDINVLRQENTDLRSQAIISQESVDQLRVRLSETQALVESSRREADNQLAETREKDLAAQRGFQNQFAALQKEKKVVDSSLENSRANESSLKDTQTWNSSEMERLRKEIAELQAADQSKQKESQQTREAVDEALKKVGLEHCTEIENFRRVVRQVGVTLKESEANAKRLGDEREQWLEGHRRGADQKIQQVQQKLAEEWKQLLEKAVRRREEEVRKECMEDRNTGPREASQGHTHQKSAIVPSIPTTTLPNIYSGKSRAIVSRRTSSVLSIEEPFRSQQSCSFGGSQAIEFVQDDGESSDFFDPVDASCDEFGSRVDIDEHGVSLLETSLEFVPETQLEGPSMGSQQINQGLVRVPGQTNSPASSLSEPDPDLFKELQQDQSSFPMVSTRTIGNHTPNDVSPQANVIQTPNLAVQKVVKDLHSNDLSRSQANTASRMAPPRSPSLRVDRARPVRMVAAKPAQSHRSLSQKSNRTGIDATSSPDSIGRPSSGDKTTYEHHIAKLASPANREDGTSRVLSQNSTSKRKSSANHAERSTPSKRYKTLSQSVSTSSTRGYQSQVSDNPTASCDPQVPLRSSSQLTSFGSGTQPVRSSRAQSRYDLRFNKELEQ